ncbi:MAG TPA: hypothetical protein VGH38_00020 [Bryobacteraceae bacterium]|jgi:hypothetical protein
MNAVTTGQGVSGVLVEKLQGLIEHLRTETGNPGWHLHMQAVQVPMYSLRIYAPDRHSQVHSMRMTMNMAAEVWEILLKELTSWQTRVLAALPVETDSAAPKTENR